MAFSIRPLWLIGALVVAGCEGGRSLPLEPCRLDGISEEVLCTRVDVLEDRTAPSGRRIALRVAVVPASNGRSKPDPLFLLAGGPGQAATDLAPWVRTVFERASRDRDVVLVDQRGTGASSPLDCEALEELFFQNVDGLAEKVRHCAEGLDADPRRYTSAEAARDLDEVRARLGYETLNLWGGSYGTRTALVYMREYPERVRSAVLDGAAPFSLRFPLHTARDAASALERLIEDCERSPDCAQTYPDLRKRIEEVRSGRSVTATSLRGFLYSTAQASLLPWVVTRASEGDWKPFEALSASVLEWSFDTMSLGMTLSVLCSEDVPRITAAEARDVPEVSLWREACAGWPADPLRPEDAQPIAFDGPVLVLSGGLDPVTPPLWGNETIRSLPRARHFVAKNVGHNVTPFGCAPALIAEFLEMGSAAGMDESCLDELTRPPFVTSPSGPEP